MSESSFYHCKHCTEDVCMEIICPCCGCGKYKKLMHEQFLHWLKIHRLGHADLLKMSKDKYDKGYVRACEIIEAEFERMIKEHTDESDRLAGDSGVLE